MVLSWTQQLEENVGRMTHSVSAPRLIVSAFALVAILSALGTPGRFFHSFKELFLRPSARFQPHRILGITFLVQYVCEVYLYLFDYASFLKSPLVWSVPLNGLLQSINAARTFTFLPRKEDAGYAAVADKSVLSYHTVVENSFYAMQLLFACCYLHHDIRPMIRKCVVIEPLLVFLVFWARHLWPASRFGASLAKSKRSDENRVKLIASAYAVRSFYIFAKHFVGHFPLYLAFLNRINHEDQRLLYGVQVLSAYACTVSIFIHTLKFKGHIGPVTAMVAYDIIIPGFLFLYYNMFAVIRRNGDVAFLTGIGLLLNLTGKPLNLPSLHPSLPVNLPYHLWQAAMLMLFYSGYLGNESVGQRWHSFWH